MDIKKRRRYVLPIMLFFLFLAYTVALTLVDVRPIGPQGSKVGFATFNRYMFDLVGVHPVWYQISEVLGMLPLLIAGSFVAAGMCQLIKRKSLKKVDADILSIGIIYALTVTIYVLFEIMVINYRPILVDGSQEPSYPSSHTMLAICIMVTASMRAYKHLQSRKVLHIIVHLLSAVTTGLIVIGRLLSGVHWATDIMAGILMSCAICSLYHALITAKNKERIHQ